MTTIERILADKRVQEVSDERGSGDGFWVYLKPGWKNDNGGEHAIHEDSPSACLRELRWAERCSCKECVSDLKQAA